MGAEVDTSTGAQAITRSTWSMGARRRTTKPCEMKHFDLYAVPVQRNSVTEFPVTDANQTYELYAQRHGTLRLVGTDPLPAAARQVTMKA
jgi:hypothetical protein